MSNADHAPVIIAVASNRLYLPWVRVFIASLTRFHPRLPVIVCGVRLSVEDIVPLRAFHAPLYLEGVTAGEDGSRNAMMANLRPYWYRRVMQKYSAGQYWFMDADLLVRRPLDDLRDLLTGRDAAVVFRQSATAGNELPLRLRVAAGLLTLRPSGSTLIDEWITTMEQSGPLDNVQPWDWYWEQICLYLATCRTALNYATIPVAEYLNPYPFDESAAIWSANGPPHLKDDMRRMFERELNP